jgi:hypothetical protein
MRVDMDRIDFTAATGTGTIVRLVNLFKSSAEHLSG